MQPENIIFGTLFGCGGLDRAQPAIVAPEVTRGNGTDLVLHPPPHVGGYVRRGIDVQAPTAIMRARIIVVGVIFVALCIEHELDFDTYASIARRHGYIAKKTA